MFIFQKTQKFSNFVYILRIKYFSYEIQGFSLRKYQILNIFLVDIKIFKQTIELSMFSLFVLLYKKDNQNIGGNKIYLKKLYFLVIFEELIIQ